MRTALAALAPPPELTVSEWADRFRYLSPIASAEPGKWRTARAEYQREIMDAICDPAVERVVGMLSSQVGKALALDTPLPTPTGWTTMGDVRPGDALLDESGSPCRVTFATDDMLDRACFRVCFSDGAEIVADADHLWSVAGDPPLPSPMTTASIAWRIRAGSVWVPELRRRRFVSVEPAPSVPVRCIQVDSASHLFLAGRTMIPTHNTEVLLNIVGYFIDQDPTSILVLMPTLSTAESWSMDRLAPMLRDTPVLAAAVNDPRSRYSGNTMLHKTFSNGRGQITLAGANSAASLASKPIRILLCDEVDRYPQSAGSEGDPVSLSTKRTTTYWNKKLVEVSSPTNAGSSRIAASYEESDQRRHWVPCHECGEFQVLTFGQVRWDDTLADNRAKARTARYHCLGCDAAWTDQQRMAAVAAGQWRAERPFEGIAGFHLNELSSPWRKLWQTVSDFLAAKNDREKLRAFVNTALAELWQEEGEVPDWERLIERREPFPMGEVPEKALCLTAGIDNQDNRLEAYVWAWAPGMQSWLIDHRVIAGSPAATETWDELQAFLATEYPHADGGTMRIHQAGMDCMGHFTSAIYQHMRRIRDPRLLALRGVDGQGRAAPVAGPSLIDIMFNGQKLKGGIKLWTVAVSMFKSDLYGRLRLTRGEGVGFPDGWVHLSDALDSEPIKQLVGERLARIKTKKGFIKSEWQKLRDRNEALDCAVYARAAISVLGVDRKGPRFWQAFARNPAEALDSDPVSDLSIQAAVAAAAMVAPRPQAAPRVGRSAYMSRLGR